MSRTLNLALRFPPDIKQDLKEDGILMLRDKITVLTLLGTN
jgi:hypothetical protein